LDEVFEFFSKPENLGKITPNWLKFNEKVKGLYTKWFEREIFGKVRYMNFNGVKRKFDIQQYISKF